MAVVVRYMCTRDGKMFEDRKQANAHDKMLESVELLRDLIEASAVAGVNEDLADELAYYLVNNKDETMAALRGQSTRPSASGDEAEDEDEESEPTAAPKPVAKAKPAKKKTRKGKVA